MNATVIKSADASQLSPVLAPLELRDVRAECMAFIESARREADTLRTRAAAETRERIVEAMELAKRRGYEAGREAGLEAGRVAGHEQALNECRVAFQADAAAVLTSLCNIQSQWRDRHRRLFVDARHDVVALAMAIARRIVPRLPDIEPSTAVETCAAALQTLGRTHELSVRANPADIDALRQFSVQSRAVEPDATILWIADESMSRGSVRLESRHGDVDATLETQLDRIADELLDDWRNRVKSKASSTSEPGT